MHYYSSLCIFVLSGYFLHLEAAKSIYHRADTSIEHSDDDRYVTLITRFRRQVGTALSDLGSWLSGISGGDELTSEKFKRESKQMGRRIIIETDTRLKDIKESQMSKILNANFFTNREKYRKQQALNAKYKKPIPPGCHVEEGIEPPKGGGDAGNNTGLPPPPTPPPNNTSSSRRRRDDAGDKDNKTSGVGAPPPEPPPTDGSVNGTLPASSGPAPSATTTPTTTTEIPLHVVCPTTTTTTTIKPAEEPAKANITGPALAPGEADKVNTTGIADTPKDR